MHAPQQPERNGTGCNPDAGPSSARVQEPEVLPPYVPPGADQISIGRVSFDQNTLIKSPCFWLLLGIAVGVGICYGVSRNSR